MDLQHRLNTIQEQLRSYITGTVEYMNDQWVFFDNETDEASLLDEIVNDSIELLIVNKWMKGTLTQEGYVELQNFHYQLKDGDLLRVKKSLSPVYMEWLEELSDLSFHHFTEMLNKYHISLFDSIYCYNHLCFQKELPNPSGTNFIVFDNLEIVCNVLHHYARGLKPFDRFEFTLSNGHRSICANII